MQVTIVAVALIGAATAVLCMLIWGWVTIRTRVVREKPAQTAAKSALEEQTRRMVEQARMENFLNFDGSEQDDPEDIAAERIANGGLK